MYPIKSDSRPECPGRPARDLPKPARTRLHSLCSVI